MIVWAYAIEIILVVALYVLAVALGYENTILLILKKTANYWITLSIALLALSGGLFWTYYAQSNSDFARWLEWKKANTVYTKAFIFPVFLYFACVISFIGLSVSSNIWLNRICLCLFLFGIVNFYNMFINVSNLIRLRAKFRIEFDEQNSGK